VGVLLEELVGVLLEELEELFDPDPPPRIPTKTIKIMKPPTIHPIT
jgi:hypothetical protein